VPDIFLPGPFADADMLAAVLGDGPPPDRVPAALVGHGLRADPHGARLALVAGPGETVRGAVAAVAPEAAARLGFALAALGAGAREVRVETTSGPATAFVATRASAPAAHWPEAPDPEWRAHLAEAAAEAMSQFGRRDPAAAAALMQGIGYRALARVRGRADAAPVRRRTRFAPDAVEPLALDRPYARYFSIEEHQLRHRRFDGRMSAPIERAVFTSGDAVTVLPFDPARRRVLLIEQFRAGPFARRDPHPWCLEAVAGRCDPGERPEATARREAREEAGLALGRIERIAAYYTSPGTMAEHITAFVGEAALDGAGGVHGVAAEDEDIRVLVLPLAEALELAAAGEVNNGPLLISILWLGREADRLAAAWSSAPRPPNSGGTTR
jgi:nudix-type nucleoside diphosphatase (YffH/AdpP family)